MKRCPNCDADLPDGYKFCDSCGAAFGQAAQLAEASPLVCQYCGTPYVEGTGFCKSCGKSASPSELNQSGVPIADCGSSVQPRCEVPSEAARIIFPQESLRMWRRKGLVVAALTLVGLLAGGGFVYWLSTGSPESKLNEAIAKGNLVKPTGESAYDFYQQLKRQGAGPYKLVQFNERLVPLLTTRPQQMLAGIADPAFKDPPPAEWEEAYKLMMWATDIRPNDGSLAARATYCAGRAAYLDGRKDEALNLWKGASERDRSWGMPANGIGLIYNERKDYAEACRFLYEAIRREPSWALPYNNLGSSFFYQKDYDQAQNYYLQAVQRAPQWPRPHAWLGDIAMIRKDYKRAVQEYETVLRLAQSGTSNIDLNKIEQQLDRARQMSVQQSSQSNSEGKDH